MTPEEQYKKYKGRKVVIVDSLTRSSYSMGIVIGYTTDPDMEYCPLIMRVIDGECGWYNLDPDDHLFDGRRNEAGYHYVEMKWIIFKFGRR